MSYADSIQKAVDDYIQMETKANAWDTLLSLMEKNIAVPGVQDAAMLDAFMESLLNQIKEHTK